jgi:hypothetical protein
MRREFPRSDFFSTLRSVRKRVACHSTCAMTLAVLLGSAPRVAGQSQKVVLSPFQRFGFQADPKGSDAFALRRLGAPQHSDIVELRSSAGPIDLVAMDTNSKPEPAVANAPREATPEFLHQVYYRNRLEFAVDVGWLPINIPFVFDIFMGDAYNMTPLKYTLVPVVASLRWQMDGIEGPSIFRGNWDMTFSASATAIPRGPESRYYSYDMGIRRNFVPHRGKIAPYFDGRVGLGRIDAREPLGVQFAQGQNFTFTVNLGSGARYNLNSRYSISAGLNWMHISNLYLSEPKFANYGINVYGPLIGLDVRLGKPRRQTE